MPSLAMYPLPAAALFTCLSALWLVSVAIANASIIDIFWGIGFCILAVGTRLQVPGGWHANVLTAMALLWGLRLAGYLAVRNLGHGEDKRYVALRQKHAPFWWKSFFLVFALQGVLTLVVGVPLVVGQAPRPDGVAWTDVAGGALFVVGWLWESVADLQLWLYKRKPESRGQLMTTGLWAFSRHPNYFGEIVLWWGIGLFALATEGGWLSLLGPVVIQFLLMRVSGVPLLESAMAERPGFAAYVARTNPLLPRIQPRR